VKKKPLIYLILVAGLCCFIELASFLTGKFLETKGVFYIEQQDLHDYAQYLKARDPVMGWPAKNDLLWYDKSGSRIIPSYPDPDKFKSCVSTYGDSYTFGDEVDHEHAWSNILSQLLKCRVANYGVGGYGTDQAFLRFQENLYDEAKVVLLGFLSENITRNVNQFRNLLGYTRYGLKPRFIVNREGMIELIPLPILSREEYINLVKQPNAYLTHEFFLLDGPSGITKLRFPFTLSILRSLTNYQMKANLLGRPHFAEFCDENHPSGGFIVTEKIITSFYDLAIKRGKKPVIIFFPSCRDLEYFKKNQRWLFQKLLDRLNDDGIYPLNLGPAMIAYLKDRNPCSICYTCSTHYNEEGNSLVAKLIYNYLKCHELIRFH